MAIKKKKISELPLVGSLDGFQTLGVDGDNRSVRVTIEQLRGNKGDDFTYKDFTPEQIAALQKPATDAISLANTATTNANTATKKADTASKNAIHAVESIQSEIDRAIFFDNVFDYDAQEIFDVIAFFKSLEIVNSTQENINVWHISDTLIGGFYIAFRLEDGNLCGVNEIKNEYIIPCDSDGGYIKLVVDWNKYKSYATSAPLYPIKSKYYKISNLENTLGSSEILGYSQKYINSEIIAINNEMADKLKSTGNSNNIIKDLTWEKGFLNFETGLIQPQFAGYKTTLNHLALNGYTFVVSQIYEPYTHQIRSFCVYDNAGTYLYGEERNSEDPTQWLFEAKVRNIPTAASIRICLLESLYNPNFEGLSVNKFTTDSITYAPKIYQESLNKPIAEASVMTEGKLKGKQLLVFGDSISARAASWNTALQSISGLDVVYNCAVGGTGIISPLFKDATIQSEIDAVNPLDPTHVISQVVTAIIKIAQNYSPDFFKEANGIYTIKPDIVAFAFGYNDVFGVLQESNLTANQYQSIKELDFTTLKSSTFNLQNGKFYANFRFAIEYLMSEIYSYNTIYRLDCTESKFYILTPIQAAKDKPEGSSIGLIDFHDILNPISTDFSATLIDNYNDSGICGRFENAGSDGKWLSDGVHPSKQGYQRMANNIIKYIK